MSKRAARNEAGDNATVSASKGKAKTVKRSKVVEPAESNMEVVVLKTTSTGEDESLAKEIEPESAHLSTAKMNVLNHWSEAAEAQLSELIAHYRTQGYAGPILWELVSSKCDYDFTAEQCMSKWYREKTKERYKTQGKKRKEASSSVRWDAEGTARLNASVQQIKSQDFEGSKLWNLVSDSLEAKWTPAQCMNKYYRDRHKQQKTKN
jgi:hypothetical protein